ncbi:hypothetical protein RJ40_06490 [Methanofollis aquaemaris]|uniref:Uncharacterized protein n=1 Tax=Methanofollis aquaemaris TaxID=126734 RepID=A0A8A3S5N5_9EURY|nr:hypothetical protein [Methanofollis aquaemaris]QSZ67169.1 hypothetical protein RJ40_06490 [Methanofollis aquaemaris]
MDPDHTIPADSPDLARTIAALANSGGGRVFIRGDTDTARTALLNALKEVVPMPTCPEGNPAPRPAHQGIARPAEISIQQVGEENGLLIMVTSGASLCTVDGVVPIFENGVVRTLSLTEVVRRAGSGG